MNALLFFQAMVIGPIDAGDIRVRPASRQSFCWKVVILALLGAIVSQTLSIAAADPLATWQMRSSGTVDALFAGIWRDGLWVVVGDNGTILTSDDDGATWIPQDSGTPAHLYSIAHGNGTFVAVGALGTVVTSPNGLLWTEQATATLSNINDVTYGNGQFVAVSTYQVMTSADGVNWVGGPEGSPERFGVAYGNNVYVTVGGYTSCLFFFCLDVTEINYSYDAVNWNYSTNVPPNAILNDLTFAHGQFVTVGNHGTIATSRDAENWTLVPTDTTSTLWNVAVGAGQYVVVGNPNLIFTSGDARTWTRRTSPLPNRLFGCVYGNGSFLALGDAGTILQSFPPPSVFNLAVTDPSIDAVTLNVTVDPAERPTAVWFEWGVTTNYENRTLPVEVSATASSLDVQQAIAGFTLGVTHYVRAFASNSVGVTSSANVTFRIGPPLAVTRPSTRTVTGDFAVNGEITPNLLPTGGWFEWGTNTQYGKTISLGSVGSVSAPVEVTGTLRELTLYATYHYRLVATNAAGVSLGQDQTLFTTPLFGTVAMWGSVDQSTVPGSAESGVTAIAAGGDFALALKTNGSIVAWGDNAFGQTTIPAAAQSGVMAIAAGYSHSVALKTDGTVLAWGDNGFGQTTIPAAAQGGATAIAAGGGFTVVLKNNGSVVAWGDDRWGSITAPVAAQNGVTAIAAGTHHIVARKNDGSVVAWGWSEYGQTTVPAGLDGVKAIAAGATHTVALKNDGSVVAWGFYQQTNVPVAAQSGVRAIAAGDFHSVALKSDGMVMAWGNNDLGQTTMPEGLNGATAIAARGYYTLVIVIPTAPTITRQPVSQTVNVGQSSSFTAAATGFPLQYQWRQNEVNIAGATQPTYSLSLVQTNHAGLYTVVVRNSAGSVTSAPPAQLTVKPASGTVVAWGDNRSGQSTVPVAAQSDVMAIAAGGSHTVVLRTNGAVLAWGWNNYGQTTIPAAAQSGVIAIAAGNSHTVALRNDGSVVAWGAGINNTGRSPNFGQSIVPVAAQSEATAIAAGSVHTVALKNDGSVVAWGAGTNNTGIYPNYGQSVVPVAAQSGVIAIAAGGTHSVALKADGTVLAWGDNGFGQTTIPAAAQSGVIAIAAGSGHSVALKTDGSVVAWGGNCCGEGTVPIAAQNGVNAIAAGGGFTLALKSDGTVVGWGDNGYNQTTAPAGLSGVTAIAAGVAHTVALIGPVPPLIITQPTHQILFAGSDVTFSVSATTDNPPLRYQWRFNGADLPGANNSSLTIANVQTADAGAYSVLVSDTLRSVPSVSVTLSLRDASAPAVTTLAATDVGSTGASLQGTVNPNGAPATAYLEYGLSTSYGSRTPPVNLPARGNAVAVNSLLTGLTPNTTYHFRLVAGNSGGTNQGADMSFTTVPLPKAGYALSFDGLDDLVSINPAGAVRAPFTVELWANPSDIVGPSGLLGSRTSEFSFDFKLRNGNQIHGDIGNGSQWITTAADASFTYAANTWHHFACVVTTTGYTIYANGAQVGSGTYTASEPVLLDARHQLFIGSVDNFRERWRGQIDEVRVWSAARSQAEILQTMNVPLSGSEPGLAAYWRFDEGAGTVAADSSGHGMTGTLINGVSRAISTAPIFTLIITQQPTNQYVSNGSDAAFSVAATTDNPPLRYQWRFNGTNIVGATNDRLTIHNVQSPNVGTYTVWVSDAVGLVSSAPATLSLLAPHIATQPVDGAVNAGSSATFSVLAFGAPPLSYQWRFNGANVVVGTNATLVVTNVQVAQVGDYTVVITNLYGSLTSHVARLEFASPPVIVVPPQSQTIIAGDDVTFTVTLTNTATLPVEYRWRRSSTTLTNMILNSRSASFTLFNVSTNSTPTSGPGSYDVIVTNIAPPLQGFRGGPVTLTVLPATAPAARTVVASNVTANSTTLNANINPVGAQTLAWFDYGLSPGYGNRTEAVRVGNASNLVAFSQTITDLLPGSYYHYRVVATNHGGMALGSDFTFTTPAPPPRPTISGYTPLPDGRFRLQFDGLASASYTVLLSTNLSNWTPLGPATEGAPGQFQFTDEAARDQPTRFYRLRSP